MTEDDRIDGPGATPAASARDGDSSRARRSVSRLGFWTAPLTAVFTAAAFTFGVTTPPRSGPFCTDSCIEYPYTDAAAYVPCDYLWMYRALIAVLLFVVLVACAHHMPPATPGGTGPSGR
jgi:hypothetical protein